MYYKNKEKQPYFEPSKEVIKRDGLVKITKEEFEQIVYDINNQPLTEEQRIQEIKSKAEELILASYSIIWQLNHPRVDIQYKSDYDFIDNIRRISNEAEANGIVLEDINWEVTNG